MIGSLWSKNPRRVRFSLEKNESHCKHVHSLRPGLHPFDRMMNEISKYAQINKHMGGLPGLRSSCIENSYSRVESANMQGDSISKEARIIRSNHRMGHIFTRISPNQLKSRELPLANMGTHTCPTGTVKEQSCRA